MTIDIKRLKTIEQIKSEIRRETIKRCWRDLIKLNTREDGALFLSPFSVDELKKKWDIK